MTALDPVQRLVPATDGVEVAVSDHGGDGPPLVFSHATGLHGRVWDPVIAHLRDRYRCLAVDHRGHGDSRIPEGTTFEWPRIAADLVAVLAHEGITTGVRMVGHSMGGCVVLLAELRQPGLLGAAWLCEPIVPPASGAVASSHGPDDNPMAALARRRREVFESRTAAIERFTGRGPFARALPEAVSAYVDHGFRDQPDGTVILKCRSETEAQVFEGSTGSGAYERLGAITAPVVVAMSGDGDVPAGLAPGVGESLPNGRLEPWPDHTHFVPLEAPALVAEAIAAAVR